ncbi:MAG: 16S rRNA (uracil(1498)-N(3))-methyltransferase [Ideonella sp.]
MPSRFYVPLPLRADQVLALPSAAARHVQVLRMQPGDALSLFDGAGAEWAARIVRIGRSDVEVLSLSALQPSPELACAVTLAIGMPTNERMDWLVEKATELGVAALQPLVCERSVLRVDGERAAKKTAHWQAVSVAACEQSGRATVPLVAPVQALQAWLKGLPPRLPGATPAASDWRGILSLNAGRPLALLLQGKPLPSRAVFLSGPEGGLTIAEEETALGAGFVPVSLGSRTLRADTAPLAALSWIGLTDAANR